ncbi:hypothetical protein EYB35_07265 [Bacillus paranthracis]|nr:hypothetical protein EYB35_07265 [Bacillus paranthracis]
MKQIVYVKQKDMNTGKCRYYLMNNDCNGKLPNYESIEHFIDWCKELDQFTDDQQLTYSLVSEHGVPQECIKCGCESYEDYGLCMPCDLEVNANVQ